uniref:CSON014744 protein n=1 Tax=Culicoides sonorensis TaxID=179676 RepID=A0A336MBI0_CULSO
MRPGPRLVVMALAFISGAQRGTTNTHNSANYKDKLVGRNNFNNINDIVKYDDDRGPLVHVNPWLSACDLAPHRKSPDLQYLNGTDKATIQIDKKYIKRFRKKLLNSRVIQKFGKSFDENISNLSGKHFYLTDGMT